MDGITGIVLSVIFGLVALVLGILNYVNKKHENDLIRQEKEEAKSIKQTELEIQLANIQKELLEIKRLILTNTEQYQALDKRVFILEQRGDGK